MTPAATTPTATAATRNPPTPAPGPAAPAPGPRTAEPTAAPGATGDTAAAVLARLVVRGRGPMTGYSRDAFGQAWADVDRNGCDTRNDVLRRDLTGLQIRPGTQGCLVLAGTLRPDPYTGQDVGYTRGGGVSVDIDHVVALGNAWVSGAAQATASARLALANDPLNLLAVDASANRQKGDGDAATWLPTRSFRCAYVARQVAVKDRYALSVTPAEKAAIEGVLATCPGQRTPRGEDAVAATAADPGASQQPAAAPDPVVAGPPAAGPFTSCAAARAAGAAPLHAGEPGYGPALDRDHDGGACE